MIDKRKALVIGFGAYDSAELSPLPAGPDDAERVAALLTSHGRFARTAPLIGPDFKGLFNALKGFVAGLEQDELGLVYVTGHAEGQGRELHLLPWDHRPGDDGVYLGDVLVHLRESARLLLVLEVCHAGLADDALELAGGRVLVLGAARADQAALELPGVGGLLTHHLCEALRGEPRPPEELFRAVQVAVNADTRSPQNAVLGRNGWQPWHEPLNPGPPATCDAHVERTAETCRWVNRFFRDAPTEDLHALYVDLAIDVAGAGKLAPEGRTLAALLALDPAEHRWVTGRWMVWGEPGSGKTTLLRHLAWDLCRQELARHERDSAGGARWIPVYLELKDVAAGRLADSLEPALRRRAEAGEVVFLLDALDEVETSGRRELAGVRIPEFARDFEDAPIVVTSRRTGVDGLRGDFVPARIAPLGGTRQRQLLKGWLGSEQAADEALGRVERAGLHELADNPLYLSLIAIQLRRGADIEVSANRARFYADAIDTLLEGHLEEPPRPVEDPEAARTALARLAWHLTGEARGDGASYSCLVRWLNTDAVARDALATVPGWSRDRRAYLEAMADEGAGLLSMPVRGTRAPWRFHHRSFREAAAAQALVGQRERDGAEAFDAWLGDHAAEDASLWAEPIALMTGLLDAPGEVVLPLVRREATRELGLRAVATAPTLDEQTILEAVGAATEDLEERRGAIVRMPEQIGDGERALLLVRRLADMLRGERPALAADDLWFLTEACRATGARWPDLRAAAAEEEARLYARREPPPADLLETRAIPAGTFVMGSPEGVGDDDERPQRSVTLTRPFRLGRTTVTNRQWRAFDPTHTVAGPDHPVTGVTWYAAQAFCRWLDPKGRLPTEAEWEYACRAGEPGKWSFGDDASRLGEYAWFTGSAKGLQPVGGLRPNAFGLYDMHGNVWEWCGDWFDRYPPGDVSDPEGPPRGVHRVMRGGCSWDSADGCRSAYRDCAHPASTWSVPGFRARLPAAPSGHRW